MANTQNKYNNVTRDIAKTNEEIEQLSGSKHVARFLFLKSKGITLEKDKKEIEQLEKNNDVARFLLLSAKIKALRKEKESLQSDILYERFARCNHIFIYTVYNHDGFTNNFSRTFECVRCGLSSAAIHSHVDMLSDRGKVMHRYLSDNIRKNEFFEWEIPLEIPWPCSIGVAKKTLGELDEKFPKEPPMFKKLFYMSLRFNMDKVRIKKQEK